MKGDTAGPRALIGELLDAVSVHGPSGYTWLGVPFLDEDGGSWGDLRARLARHLYTDYYCTGGVAPPVRGADIRLDAPLDLTSALGGTTPVNGDGGWTLRHRDADSVLVERDGLVALTDPREARLPDEARPGDAVVLDLPGIVPGAPGGFVIASGGPGSRLAGHVDRFYFNLRPAGRRPFLAALGTSLSRSGLPFRLKAMSDATILRCDAGVVYTQRVHRADVERYVREAHGLLAGYLRPLVPALTLRLAPGLGFAEDPGGTESFGEAWCRRLAEALVQAARDGAKDWSSRLTAVEREATRDHVSLAHPYLRSGSEPAALPRPLAL